MNDDDDHDCGDKEEEDDVHVSDLKELWKQEWYEAWYKKKQQEERIYYRFIDAVERNDVHETKTLVTNHFYVCD